MADFQAQHEALDQRMAALLQDYKALMDQIQTSREFYSGFKRLKMSVFGLERASKRNGPVQTPARRTPSKPDLFVKKSASPAPERAAGQAPRTDLFVRKIAKPPVVSSTTAPAETPELFKRKGPDTHLPPIPKKKPAPKADPKRKVLASSEEKEEE